MTRINVTFGSTDVAQLAVLQKVNAMVLRQKPFPSIGDQDCRSDHSPGLLVGQDEAWKRLRPGTYSNGQGNSLTFVVNGSHFQIRMFTPAVLLRRMASPLFTQFASLPLDPSIGEWPSRSSTTGFSSSLYWSVCHYYGRKNGFCLPFCPSFPRARHT